MADTIHHPGVARPIEHMHRGSRVGSVWAMAALIVYGVFGVIEVLLAFRFALRFLGANPVAPFVAAMFQVSQALIAPFAGAFGTTASLGGSVVEWTTLLAILVYAFVAWAVGASLDAVAIRTSHADDTDIRDDGHD